MHRNLKGCRFGENNFMETLKQLMPYILGFGFLIITFIGFWLNQRSYNQNQKEINEFRKANNEVNKITKNK